MSLHSRPVRVSSKTRNLAKAWQIRLNNTPGGRNIKFLLRSRFFRAWKKAVASRLHVAHYGGQCGSLCVLLRSRNANARCSLRADLSRFFPRRNRERERGGEKSGVSAVFILPDLFLSRHNYIAIPLINQRQPVSRRSRGLILLIFYQPTTPFTLTFELI